jgi:hypothetical protein
MVPVSVDLGTAPMTVSSFWPSLKIITVGIERMPYSVATLGLSSVLSFTYEKKNIEDEQRDGRVSAGARHSRARRDDWEKKRHTEREKKTDGLSFPDWKRSARVNRVAPVRILSAPLRGVFVGTPGRGASDAAVARARTRPRG